MISAIAFTCIIFKRISFVQNYLIDVKNVLDALGGKTDAIIFVLIT
jgi:hypothetical protein